MSEVTWKVYRLTRTQVGTCNLDGKRRVLELLDGRTLIEREGAPSRIINAHFERALVIVETEPRSGERLSWWWRFRKWLGAKIAGDL